MGTKLIKTIEIFSNHLFLKSKRVLFLIPSISIFIIVLMLLCVLQVFHQLPNKLHRAQKYYVTNFVLESLNKMPAKAVIIY